MASILDVITYIGIGNLLAAISLCLLIFWYVRTNYLTSFYYRLPPGPPAIPHPFDGLMALFPVKDRFGRLVQLCNRYGDIVCLQLGSKIMTMISSPGLVKELLVKQADVTSNRLPPPFFTHVIDYTGGIIFTDGEPWQELRRFSLSALRNFGMGRKGIESRIQEEAHTLCNAFSQQSGKAFDAMHLTNAAVSNIICSITFGRRLEYDDPVFIDMIQRLRNLTGGMGINPIIRELIGRFPILLKTPILKMPKENILGIKNFINEEVREHLESYDSTDIRDIIDMYLAETDRLEEIKATKPYLTKDDIWMCVFDLFFAGTETTSSSLLWFMLVMASKPDVQDKVMSEIDRVVGRERAPCFDDRKDLPYVDATITEVLRFRPVAPVGVGHVTAKDVKIREYTIPKHTEILINILAIHLDPNLWDKPEEFNPERFLSEDGKTVIKQDAFTVFGAGRRVCLGEQLARMEFFLFATTLMQRFQFQLPEGDSADFGFEHCLGTIAPKRYKVLAHER
ncbi:cytochrome P450 2C15-like [Lytechinus variegatus]|uniref:cytochrome P450 2C15-like n=1 Tax=Lytechinus variegatus TaxID=7654 RepID=UPI001BB24AA5|nr:cytochrome P450 2C15-like [Lytechinus variegatus]